MEYYDVYDYGYYEYCLGLILESYHKYRSDYCYYNSLDSNSTFGIFGAAWKIEEEKSGSGGPSCRM